MTRPAAAHHSDATKAEIVRLYVTEGFTASETARMLGLASRNVCIGVAYRLGYRLPERRCITMKKPPKMKVVKPPKPIKIVAAMPEPKAAPLRPHATLTDRARDGCCWPVGELDGEVSFCNAVRENHMWCRQHVQLGYAPKQPKRASLMRMAEGRV